MSPTRSTTSSAACRSPAASGSTRGKTGTTSGNKAVWFDGYTPNLATSAMIAGANSKGHPLSLNGQTVGGVYIQGAHGSTTAGPMWGDAMKVIQSYLPDDDFNSPNPQTIAGQSVIVPSVGGMGTDAAAAVLRKAGFTPVVGPTVDSGYPAGTAAYLSPGSGVTAPTGSTVTIYVSDGTPYVAPQPPPKQQGGGGNGGGGGGKKGHGNGKGH